MIHDSMYPILDIYNLKLDKALTSKISFLKILQGVKMSNTCKGKSQYLVHISSQMSSARNVSNITLNFKCLCYKTNKYFYILNFIVNPISNAKTSKILASKEISSIFESFINII